MVEIETPASAEQTDQPEPDCDQTSDSKFPICGVCGSERIVRDAWASWNAESRDWALNAVFDYTFCLTCEEEAGLEWRSKPLTRTERIRMLNDALRTGLPGKK